MRWAPSEHMLRIRIVIASARAIVRTGQGTHQQSWLSPAFDCLKRELEQECRFHIVVARLEVGGYCSACRR